MVIDRLLKYKRKEVVSLEIFTFDCSGCGKCIRKCLKNVLEIVNNGYCKYAIVSLRDKCDGCGKCLKVCKKKAIQLITD